MRRSTNLSFESPVPLRVLSVPVMLTVGTSDTEGVVGTDAAVGGGRCRCY